MPDAALGGRRGPRSPASASACSDPAAPRAAGPSGRAAAMLLGPDTRVWDGGAANAACIGLCKSFRLQRLWVSGFGCRRRSRREGAVASAAIPLFRWCSAGVFTMSKPDPKTVKDVLSHAFVKEYSAYLRSTGKVNGRRPGRRQAQAGSVCCFSTLPTVSTRGRRHSSIAGLTRMSQRRRFECFRAAGRMCCTGWRCLWRRTGAGEASTADSEAFPALRP